MDSLSVDLNEFRKIANTPSSFEIEETKAKKKLIEEEIERQEEKGMVLDRIKQEASNLKKESLEGKLDYTDPKEIKGQFNRLKKEGEDSKEEGPKFTEVGVNRGGRPKIADEKKAKDPKCTIRADLFSKIEGKKVKDGAKTRSSVMNEVLEKGFRYIDLRNKQCKKIEMMVTSFGKSLEAIKIRSEERIDLEENKKILAALFNQSMEIRAYLIAGGINPETLTEVEDFFTLKRLEEIRFSCNPTRFASLVSLKKGRG